MESMGQAWSRASRRNIILSWAFGLCLVFVFVPAVADAATLSLSPGSGAFEAGSTFEVSVFLNTEGKTINALHIALDFPADKIQLVSSPPGESIVALWVTPPKFNNTAGRVELQGGIPGGINVERGRVIILTFRVKQVGFGVVRFLDETQVYLHDGKGTEILHQAQNGVYQFVLPPPAGPIVASTTQPDQTKWYPDSNLVVSWASIEAAEEYSYELNREPISIPDNTSEGTRNSVAYTGLADGSHYFHIKGFRDGAWGGTTHFAVNVDMTPPAEFSVNIRPSAKTTNPQPVIEFFTTDISSGVSHYELRLVPMFTQWEVRAAEEILFIEVTSPYVPPELALGNYDVLIRSYDIAGNYRELVKKLEIVNPLFRVEDTGIVIGSAQRIPWAAVFSLILVFSLLFGGIAWRVRRWRGQVDSRRSKRELPDPVKEKLEELKRYRSKYGKLAVFALAFCAMLFLGASLASAQETLNPPFISTVSRDISNEEIFYVGGKTEIPQTEVVLYLQNLRTGETITRVAPVDKKGDWFYRHDAFLGTGTYLLWAQTRAGEGVSPPTPQIEFTVEQTAIQFGASRMSTADFYLALSIILFLGLLGLISYIIFHGVQARKSYLQFRKEVQEAEEAVRRGFAVLRRDIEVELTALQAKSVPSKKEAQRKEELISDFSAIERRIGKEILDIKQLDFPG